MKIGFYFFSHFRTMIVISLRRHDFAGQPRSSIAARIQHCEWSAHRSARTRTKPVSIPPTKPKPAAFCNSPKAGMMGTIFFNENSLSKIAENFFVAAVTGISRTRNQIRGNRPSRP